MHAYPARGETGDDDAFATMCAEHRARLVAYCKRRLRISEDAEDAAHEALVRAYRAMPSFDDSADAWPWLRTIAARVCTDMQRRAARAAAPGLVDVRGPEDVHEQVVDRLRADILEDALERLSPRYRSALLLREYGGWSYEEIAKAQGRSLPSVRSILTRGRRRLGAHVESVARSRGQWPLPGAVPPLRRLREQVRSWREAVERGPALASAVELSSLATRFVLGAQTATAAVIGVTAAVTSGVVPSAEPHDSLPGSSSRAPATAVVEPPRPALAIGVAAASAESKVAAQANAAPRATLADVETVTAVSDDYAPGLRAGGGAGIDGDGDTVWVRDYHRVNLPIVGPVGSSGETNIPCTWDAARALACTVLRTAATQCSSDPASIAVCTE